MDEKKKKRREMESQPVRIHTNSAMFPQVDKGDGGKGRRELIKQKKVVTAANEFYQAEKELPRAPDLPGNKDPALEFRDREWSREKKSRRGKKKFHSRSFPGHPAMYHTP